MKNVTLLECTLRDGAYKVDFMIDQETCCAFAEKLVRIGFQDIEVGHGLGLGAYRQYSAGFTDEALYKRLAPLAARSRLYSFFIPSVGKPDDFRMARDYGLYGLRVGAEPVYVLDSIPTLEAAKSLGYFVALNVMKSYTVTPDGFAKLVETVKDFVDVIYLVDSAGHMLPEELRAYVRAIQDRVGMIALGYHGHNNLGLAVASALELIDEGVQYIDTTLTGIGRSGGNIPTETMLAVLAKKYGVQYCSDDFLLQTLGVARQFREYVLSTGKSLDFRSEDILFGYAGFHSSYEDLLRRVAERQGQDFHQAILDVSRREQVCLTEATLTDIFREINASQASGAWSRAQKKDA